MRLAPRTFAPILSEMLLGRLIGSLLIILALVLGPSIAAASAAGMADGMSAHGMNEPTPDGCPDCNDNGAQMAACAKTMCATFPGILPAGNDPLFGARLSFVAGADESLAGMSRLPDPKPPRTIVLG